MDPDEFFSDSLNDKETTEPLSPGRNEVSEEGTQNYTAQALTTEGHYESVHGEGTLESDSTLRNTENAQDDLEDAEKAQLPLFGEDDEYPDSLEEIAKEKKNVEEEEDFNSQDYEDEDRDLFVEEEEEVENSGRSRLKKRKRLDEYGEDYQEEDGEYDPNIGEEEVEGEGEENFEEDEAQTTAPKPKRRRKKKEEDPDAPPRELTEEEKIEKEFEDHVLGAVKREKATICKRKKIPTSEIDAHVAVYNNHILTLAERMSDAYREDARSMNAGKIAVEKLKLLDEVVRGMQLRNPAEDIKLDSDDTDRPVVAVEFLSELARPNKDGTLPTLKIRDSILKNLDRLNVSSEALEKSELGKSVMTLSKHRKELDHNRRICKQLISKWSRPIFGINSNYAQDEGPPPSPVAPRMPVRRPRTSSGRTNLDSFELGDSVDSDQRSYAFPVKSSMDFSRKPKSIESKQHRSRAVQEKELAYKHAFQNTKAAKRSASSGKGNGGDEGRRTEKIFEEDEE